MGLYLRVRIEELVFADRARIFSSFCFQSKDFVWPLNKVNTEFTVPFSKCTLRCGYVVYITVSDTSSSTKKSHSRLRQPWYSLVEPVLIDKTTGEQSEISYKRFLPSTQRYSFLPKGLRFLPFFFLVKSSTIWLFTVSLQSALSEGGLKF